MAICKILTKFENEPWQDTIQVSVYCHLFAKIVIPAKTNQYEKRLQPDLAAAVSV